MYSATAYTIRSATPDDAAILERLAALDSQRPIEFNVPFDGVLREIDSHHFRARQSPFDLATQFSPCAELIAPTLGMPFFGRQRYEQLPSSRPLQTL